MEILITEFIKMSVISLVCTLSNFGCVLAQKLVWISKQNFTCIFGALSLRAN